MSGPDGVSDGPTDTDSLLVEPAADLLAGSPETAYFWGYVAGSGEVSDDGIEVTTTDETAAARLATVAGATVDDLERETSTRDYAHDASITRTEDEFTVHIATDETGRLFGRTSTLGFPVDGRGNYRFTAFSGHERDLLRGLLESCGTVCFKSSAGTVGISFVHDDGDLLAGIRRLIADCPVDAPTGEPAETASGGYWFGVDDDAAPDFGPWVYEGSEESGLFAPSRRRKLERSIEEAAAYEDDDADAAASRADAGSENSGERPSNSGA